MDNCANASKKLTPVDIYTDGACSGNPGPGGWAYIIKFGVHEKAESGFEAFTTNNRMELMAAIKGISALTRPCTINLFSDSAYLISAFNAGWLASWQKKGWKNAAGAPVSNPDLWQELLKLSRVHKITWIKVKGHADHAYNNRCDAMAVEEIKHNKATV